MSRDNSTGKDKEFYERGKKMFDRLNPPGTPAFKPYFPKREWVGLTDEEIEEFENMELGTHDLCLEIEAKLQEKNT